MTGEEIKKLREKYGLTQTQMGQDLGTTDTRISEWEHGKKMAKISEKAVFYYFKYQECLNKKG